MPAPNRPTHRKRNAPLIVRRTPSKTKPRLFVSVPDDRHLDERRKSLKRAILKFIRGRGFDLIGFEPEQFGGDLQTNLTAWTVARANSLIRRCDAVLVFALAKSPAPRPSDGDIASAQLPSTPRPAPTTYNHLEGALALSQDLPAFILCEEGMERSGIFDCGIKPIFIPPDADPSWLRSTLAVYLEDWTARCIEKRRDVFFGYCSKANGVASRIIAHLEEQHGFSVTDWARDFKPAGATILEEIEDASSRCRAAIFLFTRDDEIEGKASISHLPRDNVLVEAGYFTRSHGKKRVAIIREEGVKMPSDFGGVIYLSFKSRRNLGPMMQRLVKHLTAVLRTHPDHWDD